MNEPYDSTADTLEHINRVRFWMNQAIIKLTRRADVHDQSKLQSPEKDAFDILTPRLKGLTYGSDEYRASLREMKPAIKHHYESNTHHPEHWAGGIDDMSLLDVLEMLCDWKAAGERHADGSMEKSLLHNRDRFKISDQLHAILTNTAEELGWLDVKSKD